MATLLLTLKGNRTFNRTVWPPYLFIYDDLLAYRKRKWHVLQEITIAYSQISQVMLKRGIFFASLDVITTGTDDIAVRFVNKKLAHRAKQIIDRKIYHAYAKHHPKEEDITKKELHAYEKSLNRLKVLLNRDRITEKEFKKKKKELLKKL